MKNSASGHGFMTAVESAFDMVLTSPYPKTGEKFFSLVADQFSSKAHLNFPYYYYSPPGRTHFRNLTLREMVLHRAIRARKPSIVRLLLGNDADWEMANANWQSPLRLATLVSEGREPDLHANHGSFMQRMSPMRPPSHVIINETNSSVDAAGEVLHLMEDYASSQPRVWYRILWPGSLFRALGEVRWPWSEYEADNLDVRFLIFYALCLSITVGLFWLAMFL